LSVVIKALFSKSAQACALVDPATVDVAVSVRALVKEYRNGSRANRGIDLDVPRGEIIAVLGPNGAGKTTFLRQLTTEIRPTSGSIRVFGIDAVREPARVKRLMGIMPQEAGLFDTLTVRTHLELFARLKGLSRAAAVNATVSVVTALGLAPELDARVGALSGGQRRRILIALALLGDPPLLVLDEPTTGLDPASRRGVWFLLRRIAHHGTTIMLSTHYLDEADHLSHRIAIVHAGQIVACGTRAELLGRMPTRGSLEAMYFAITGERVADRDREDSTR
jgi:ABC-2 type transport system ATP-binding protein